MNNSTHAPLAQSLDEGLRELFGFDEFREGQREAMDDIMAGWDAAVVMPTGLGKRVCYELTACAEAGVRLVISPLIAPMKDAADSLKKAGSPVTGITASTYCD